MKDPVEERLEDLEQLVLKQAERIEALEEALTIMRHIARVDILARARTEEAA